MFKALANAMCKTLQRRLSKALACAKNPHVKKIQTSSANIHVKVAEESSSSEPVVKKSKSSSSSSKSSEVNKSNNETNKTLVKIIIEHCNS